MKKLIILLVCVALFITLLLISISFFVQCKNIKFPQVYETECNQNTIGSKAFDQCNNCFCTCDSSGQKCGFQCTEIGCGIPKSLHSVCKLIK